MKIPATILSFILTMALFYLMGAFIGNSFNIGDWNTDGRFFCMLLGFMVGCVAAGFTYAELNGSN